MNLKENAKPSLPAENIPIRLHVYLAHAGVASRRAAEDLISQGRITVNGRKVSTPGEKVLPGDEVCFDGKAVRLENSFVYLMLNKPPLYICSSSDPQGRPLALDLLPRSHVRLYNVGRLDYLSSGLIIFTNDGEFAAHIGHPRADLQKEYLIESKSPVPERLVEEFTRGLIIDGILYRAHLIEKIGKKSLRIVLIEGKNREIRRVFSHFRQHPTRLQRVRIGPVYLNDLEEGESRPLTAGELHELRSRTW